MKLKFINLLLVSALLVGSAQVFTSCKDNEADVLVDLKADTITLKQKLEDDEKALADLEAALKKEIADREAAVQNLSKDLQNFKDQVAKDYATKQELANEIDKVTKKIKDNADAIATLKGDLALVQGAITLINTRLDGIDVDLEKIKADIKKNADDIVVINTAIGDIKIDITKINERIDGLVDALADLGVKVEGIEGRVTVVEGTLATVQADLSALTERVGNLETSVGTLNNFMNTWEPLLPEIQQNAAQALATANQNAIDIQALQEIVKLLQEQVALGNEQCAAALDMVESQIADLTAKVENCATLAELAEAVDMLQKQAQEYYNASIAYTMYMVAGLRTYVNECLSDVNASITDINIAIGNINTNLNDLNDKVDLSVANLTKRLNDIEEAYQKNDNALGVEILNLKHEMNEKIAALDNKISENFLLVIGKCEALKNDLDALGITVDGIQDDLDALNTALTTGLQAANNKINDLTERVDALEEALAPLSARIEEVAGRINGIIIQQTDNAVFGTLNLPVGISSNMLLAYASDNAVDAYFPTTEGYYSYNGVVEGLGVAEDEVLPFKGNDEVNCVGAIMERDEETGLGVLGTVYLTINPANVDLSDKKFAIVTSTGKVLPIQIAPVASDKELNFGYTRAAANGFYEAKALIDVNDLDAVRFTLDKNFKSTVASIVKQPSSLKNAQTIAQLANALYSQVNGVLPALGVQASWTESTGNMMVTSQYGLAAATFNPLALGTFLAIDGKLPHIPNVPDLSGLADRFDVVWDELTGKLNIQIYDPNHPFTVDLGDGIKINITIPNVSLDGNFSDISVKVPLNDVKVTVPIEVKVYDNDGVQIGEAKGSSTATLNTQVSTSVDLSSLATDIQDEINKALDGVRDINNLEKEINAQLKSIADQIETQVNDMLSGMQNTIDNAFDTVKNFVDGKLNSLENRLGTYVDRVQALINRVNGMLSTPSHYMQPVLLYKGINGNVGRMSTAANMPTVINSSVSNPGIVLVPTTYTLETVVPLYQKYVAVTKVWANGDANHTNVPAVQDAANNTQYINEVVNAQRHLIACSLQKGYTYEILYQGLDYSGKVSGNKYYVTVK